MSIDTLDRQSCGEAALKIEGLPPEKCNRIATSLHASLMLADILRAARSALQLEFPLERLTLVQHRTTESAATLCSLDEEAGAPLIGPMVFLVEDSRLKQCISDREPRVVCACDVAGLDAIELKYLVQTGTKSVVYAPLELGKKLKGILILASRDEVPLTAAQTNLLAHVTSHLAQAIENSDMYYLECRHGRRTRDGKRNRQAGCDG